MMLEHWRGGLLCIALAAVTSAHAQGPAGTKPTSGQVERKPFEQYVNGFALLVADIDTEGLDVEAVARWLSQRLPEAGLTIEEAANAKIWIEDRAASARLWLSEFRQLGGRRIYQYTGMPNIADHGTYWAFPLAPGHEAELLSGWITQQSPEERRAPDVAQCQAVTRDGAVLFIPHIQLRALERGTGRRAKLVEALDAAGPAPLRVGFENSLWVMNDWLVPEASRPGRCSSTFPGLLPRSTCRRSRGCAS